MAKKVLTTESISSKDFTVAFGKLRVKESFATVVSADINGDLVAFDIGDPLAGWVKPTNMRDMGTAVVQFTGGIAFFQYVSSVWQFRFYQGV